MTYIKRLKDLFMLTVHATGEDEEEYNSQWTGAQIDSAVGTVRGNSTAWSAKATKATYNTTISSSSWQENNDGGYIIQTQAVNGILATDTPIISVVQTGTYETDAVLLEAWSLVSRVVTKANGLTLYAYGDAPTVNIPLQILCLR